VSASPDKPAPRGLLKQARRDADEVERLLNKVGARLGKTERERVAGAVADVRAAVESRDKEGLERAQQQLEAAVDQHLAFAKKSATREYVESILVAVVIAGLLRFFVVEAFKIPSGSMIPTLEVGDHIFVNKFIYGLRVPLTNAWIAEWGTPSRGDVVVFRFPRDPSKDYIKRVVAVAGDRVRAEGRDVFVNGAPLPHQAQPTYSYVEEGDEDGFFESSPDVRRSAVAFTEESRGGEQRYSVIYDEGLGAARAPFPMGQELPGLDCGPPTLEGPGECVVQPGFVFAMGDNRDNSSDGRVWGGVPVSFIKGKAMFVWWSRGPRTGVRWGRMGTAVH
jgi:signal peptidase I